MDKFNIVLIVLIFTSLVVIIGIFGKNLKNFKQAEKNLKLRGKIEKGTEKKGKLFVGFIFSKISDFFVWIAETIVGGAGSALKNAQTALLEMKAKKNTKEYSQNSSNQLNKEAPKDDKVSEKLVKNKLNNLKDRFSRKNKESSLGESAIIKLGSLKGGVATDSSEKESKDIKLRDFFQDQNKTTQKVEDTPKNDYFEQEKEIEREIEREVFQQRDTSKGSFFSKMNPFKKEEKTEERRILTEEIFNEYPDGITTPKRDSSEEKRSEYMKDVVRRKHFSRKERKDDEELGIDRKILEKRILQKIATNPKGIEGYRQLGELYIKMENFEDAHSAYRFILKISARDADASRKLDKIKLLKRLK